MPEKSACTFHYLVIYTLHDYRPYLRSIAWPCRGVPVGFRLPLTPPVAHSGPHSAPLYDFFNRKWHAQPQNAKLLRINKLQFSDRKRNAIVRDHILIPLQFSISTLPLESAPHLGAFTLPLQSLAATAESIANHEKVFAFSSPCVTLPSWLKARRGTNSLLHCRAKDSRHSVPAWESLPPRGGQ